LTAQRVSKGSYALFMRFSETFSVSVGALGNVTITKGEYCYAGSAMNGLDQRIRRH
jgi:Uri superfamily endonuclease